MKVLFRSPNWIGDAVLALAAVQEYRETNPEHRIWILANPWVSAIFRQSDCVEGVVIYPAESLARWRGPRLRLSALSRLWAQLRSFRFERAILLQNAFEAALLMRLARIPDRIGYGVQLRGSLLSRKARPRLEKVGTLRRFARRLTLRVGLDARGEMMFPRGRRDHEVHYYLDLLFQTGLISKDYLGSGMPPPKPRLRTTPEGVQKARALLQEQAINSDQLLVLLNPGSAYGSAKRWATENFARLAEQLKRGLGCQVAILAWDQEAEISKWVAPGMSHSPHVFTGPADLERTIGLLSLCNLLVTNDSGLMHLAAALGKPQIALFGSTDPQTTGPLSSSARVIWKAPTCSPCHLRACPVDRRCWNRITPEEVVEAAGSLLGTKGSEPDC